MIMTRYSYKGCTNVKNSYPYSTEQSYCVANQSEFNERDFLNPNSKNIKPVGWTTCSSKCSKEFKICEECDFPFKYDDQSFDECTTHRSDIFDETRQELVPWCKVKPNKFNYEDEEKFQWQYCSWNCGKYSNGMHNL